jgi:hypothetical protein
MFLVQHLPEGNRMRLLLAFALLPALAQADEIEFTVTGSIFQSLPIGPDPPTSVWKGSGPIPTTFQMILVNTLAPRDSLTYAFAPDTSLDSVAFSVAATDFNFTLGGQTLVSGGSGSFSASGSQLGECSFIGGTYSASTASGTFGGVPDFSLGGGCITKSQLLGSSDPLGLLLSHSSFVPDDGWNGSFLSVGTSTLVSVENVSGVSVPEPDSLALFAAGGLGLFACRRRRKT